jgi:hypothetical protein
VHGQRTRHRGRARAANLLSKCIVLVSAEAVESGLRVRATGADDERVRDEFAAELGPDGFFHYRPERTPDAIQDSLPGEVNLDDRDKRGVLEFKLEASEHLDDIVNSVERWEEMHLLVCWERWSHNANAFR